MALFCTQKVDVVVEQINPIAGLIDGVVVYGFGGADIARSPVQDGQQVQCIGVGFLVCQRFEGKGEGSGWVVVQQCLGRQVPVKHGQEFILIDSTPSDTAAARKVVNHNVWALQRKVSLGWFVIRLKDPASHMVAADDHALVPVEDRGRIDQLELDYQELMRLSQAVDSQVETLQYSHDSMQAIQLKLRNLEELQSSVDEKFQRMKTKEEVISNTSKAIDTSFIRIQEIEGTIQGIDSELSLVPRKIDGVFAMIQEIQQDKSSIEHVVSQMGNLNDMLQDVEKRIEKMQQAREWLARTETRFEEINRSADEQLRMLGSLLKEQGSDNKRKGKDVPTVQERDTVIKLSRNGWHVEEIAKATKLSPGEVELILEIAHK